MVLSKAIARYGRVDLLCIGLCRHRDYAEDGRCSELGRVTAAFFAVGVVGVSA
jgi:hypothetical protein